MIRLARVNAPRRVSLFAVTALVLAACDEPVGPQPDKPIRPPPGYNGAPPPGPPGPPQPVAAPPKPEGEAAPAPAPAPLEPEPQRCPADVSSLLTAKAKPTKEKRKRFMLQLGARSGGPTISFKKVVRSEGGFAENVEAKGADLTAYLVPTQVKEKMSVTLSVTCGWEDRLLAVTLDPRGAAVAMKEALPPPEPGFLSVLADAGTKVSASGRDLGVTPLKGLPMPPGKYTLRLEPKKGKPRIVAVEISSGETTNVAADLPKKK